MSVKGLTIAESVVLEFVIPGKKINVDDLGCIFALHPVKRCLELLRQQHGRREIRMLVESRVFRGGASLIAVQKHLYYLGN